MVPKEIGLPLLLVCILGPWFSVAGRQRKCDLSRDMPNIQILCKEQNELLLHYINEHNNKKLCRHLILVLKCVADNVTRCYDDFHEIHELYFQSPYYCKLTIKHIREIQAIRNSKAKQRTKKPKTTTTPSVTFQPSAANVTSSDDKNDVTNSPSSRSDGEGDVTLSSKGSSKATNHVTISPANEKEVDKSGSSSSSDGKEVEEGTDEGYTVSKGEKDVSNEGSREGHTGSKSGHENSSRCPTIHVVLVTMVIALSIKMTSSLLI